MLIFFDFPNPSGIEGFRPLPLHLYKCTIEGVLWNDTYVSYLLCNHYYDDGANIRVLSERCGWLRARAGWTALEINEENLTPEVIEAYSMIYPGIKNWDNIL